MSDFDEDDPPPYLEWVLSILIAATLGCVITALFLLSIFFKFVSIVVYPVGTVLLMVASYFVLTKLVIGPSDPRHISIQGGVIVGGLLSVIIAFFVSGASSIEALFKAGASMATLALLSIALEQYRIFRALRAADKALIDAESCRRSIAEGDYQDADELLQEALLTTEMAYGSIHPQVATIVGSLAKVARAQERFGPATLMRQRAVGVWLKLPEHHNELIVGLYHYAELLRETGDLKRALSVAKRGVAECRRHRERGPILGRTWLTISRVQAALGKIQDSCRSTKTAAALLEETLGEAHPETLQAEGLMATHCVNLGRLAEGERIVREVLEKKELSEARPDAEYLNLHLDLMAVQDKRNDHDHSSQSVLQNALEIFRASVGPAYERKDELIERAPVYLSGQATGELHDFYEVLLAKMSGTVRGVLRKNPRLVNHVDASGWIPLQWAVFLDARDIIECLLSMGGDHSFGKGTGLPALYIASRWKRKWAIQALLRKGAELEAPTGDGSRAVHGAVRSGDQLTLDSLTANQVDLTSPNTRGWTPVHEAAFIGHRRLLIELLSRGGEADFRGGTQLESPLYAAVLGESWSTVESLIVNNADVNAPNYRGVSPLRLAQQRCLDDIAELLESHAALAPSENAEAG